MGLSAIHVCDFSHSYKLSKSENKVYLFFMFFNTELTMAVRIMKK